MKSNMRLAPAIAIAAALAGAAGAMASTGELADAFVNQDTARNPGQIDKSVRDSMFSAREEICSEIDARVDASDKAMIRMRAYSDNLTADARTSFDAAVTEANAREQDLKKSLEVAANANADAWDGARVAVATNYNLYAEAVAHAEALVLAGIASSASATVASIAK